MEPSDPHNDHAVKPLADCITDLAKIIETEKGKRRQLQAELQNSLTEIDGAAHDIDRWTAIVEKLTAEMHTRRDALDARQDAASDVLAELGAGEMGGAHS